MPEKENRIKSHLLWLFASAMGFAGMYYFSQLSLFRVPYLLSSSSTDKIIPFIPWTLVIYATHYPLILTAWLCALKKRPLHFLAPFIICSGLTFIFYAMFPTIISRPVSGAGSWQNAYAILHLIDGPGNCLPSLHVSLALLGGLSVLGCSSRFKFWFWVWVVSVCVSTLTTKQHVFVDVLGGFIMAGVSWYTARHLSGHVNKFSVLIFLAFLAACTQSDNSIQVVNHLTDPLSGPPGWQFR